MSEKTSGDWMKEYVRLQEELIGIAGWVEATGITEDQRARRVKAAQAIFEEAVSALNKSVETWAKELALRGPRKRVVSGAP